MNNKKIKKVVNNEEIVEKIKQTKQKKSLLFKEFYYYRNMELKLTEIHSKLNINYRTILKMNKQFKMIEQIHNVTIDRGLKELIFNTVQEIKLFDYLTTDLNFWKTYEQVNIDVPISRYYFKRVKEYILEEVNNNSHE